MRLEMDSVARLRPDVWLRCRIADISARMILEIGLHPKTNGCVGRTPRHHTHR